MNYWLMKTEPDVFSLDDLKKSPDGTAPWEGVRNYQARNFMRDQMKKGDLVLFYHSRHDPPEVVGICQVVKESYPDFTALDSKSQYFDPKATEVNPRWFMVNVKFIEAFTHPVSLEMMRQHQELEGLMVIKKGMRLSIQPVEKNHFNFIHKLGNK